MEQTFDILSEAARVFDVELAALAATKSTLGSSFETLAQTVLACTGKVILTGMGKPGHICEKIAASLASLGTPAFFMHPGEAMHGDLGMVSAHDVVLLVSYSGETAEVTGLLSALHEIGATTIALTGNPKSTLARGAKQAYCFPPFEEACYLHLAPTSSTTALLVLGDALAVTLARARGYTRADFGLHHPAGSLGKKLLLRVSDVMHGGAENATVTADASLRAAIVEMSKKGLSMVTVTDENGGLLGILTDGDLRRMLERGVDVYAESVANVMTKQPKWIASGEMAVNALQRMTDLTITGMPVLNDHGMVVGSVLMQDIIKTGIVQ